MDEKRMKRALRWIAAYVVNVSVGTAEVAGPGALVAQIRDGVRAGLEIMGVPKGTADSPQEIFNQLKEWDAKTFQLETNSEIEEMDEDKVKVRMSGPPEVLEDIREIAKRQLAAVPEDIFPEKLRENAHYRDPLSIAHWICREELVRRLSGGKWGVEKTEDPLSYTLVRKRT